jgi:hypothetical protein
MDMLNLLHTARSLPPHTQVKPRLQALLICWCQEASLVKKHRGPASPLSLTAREPLFPHQRAKMPHSPLRGGKLKPGTLRVASEALFSPRQTEAQGFTVHFPAGEYKSKSWNPSSSTEWQFASLLILGGLPPTVQRPSVPHYSCRKAPVPPSKNGNSSLHTEGRKEAIGTKRIWQGVT